MSRPTVGSVKFSRTESDAEQRLVAALARDVGDAAARPRPPASRSGRRALRRLADDAARTGPAPQRARRNASWPWPSSPASPTISPACSSKSISAPPGRSRTPEARSTTSAERGRSARACPVSVRCSAPVISRTSSAAETSPRARVATVSPARITVTRSPISSTSSIRWEMKIVLVPPAARRRTISKSRSRVATSSAEVASSSTRTCGRRMSARAMQHAWRSLSESSSTGRPRSGDAPVSSSSVSEARSCRSALDTASRWSASSPSHRLSRIERGGTTSTSWNTATIPSSERLPRRVDRGERRPSTSIEPRSGRWTPVRILTSVLLPEPFSPTIACTSPRRSSNVHERTACVGPNALARSTVRRANVAPASGAMDVLTRLLTSTGRGRAGARPRARTG